MKILVLGGDGMLGHQLLRHLQKNHDVKVTLRQDSKVYQPFDLFTKKNSYPGVDARYIDSLHGALAEFRPHCVVNAVGIIKQRQTAKEIIPCIEINALFPHRLVHLCQIINARLIHLSTDCVFSGKKGNYREEDIADAGDLYGRSKLMGEIDQENCITLRTSMIGRELSRKTSLLEWFLAQKGTIRGFRRAIFTGFTTIELSRIIEKIIIDKTNKSGMFHVSSDPISKYDLLSMIKKHLNLQIHIEPDDSFECDRSLVSKRFRKQFGYKPPTWEKMINELCKEEKPQE